MNGIASFDEIGNRLHAFEQKLSKLDALVDALDNLCNAIQNIKLEEVIRDKTLNLSSDKPQTNGNNDDNVDANVHDDNEEWNRIKERTLKVVSFESGGLVNDEIDVSITYIADAGYISEWFLSRKYHDHTSRDNGQITTELLGNNSIKFTTKTTLRDLDSLEWASLMITSTAYNVRISLNKSALSEKGTQMFDEPDKEILHMTPRILATADDLKNNGFNTTITVTENVVEGMRQDRYHTYVVMSLVNADTNPPELFEFWANDYANSNLTVSVKNDSDNELVVRLTENFAVHGGIIQIMLPQKASGYIWQFHYGNEFKLINQDIGDVMPRGTFGLYKSRKRMHVQGPYLSHLCLAFGIPLPKLTLFKSGKDGSLVETETDYKFERGIYKLSILQFEPSKASKPDGDYICQASDGNITLQHKTTYLPLQEVQIDEEKTRLTKNTTEKTIVTCKATGNPTPKLELKVDNEYGPDLIEREPARYKHSFNTRKNVSKVKLEIQPPDEAISVIFCVARQELDVNVEIRKSKEIKIRDKRLDDGYNSVNSTTFFNYTVSEARVYP